MRIRAVSGCQWCRVALACLASVLWVAFLSVAQSTPASAPTNLQTSASQSGAPQISVPTLTIRQTVRRVIVDVTVLDDKGNPVRGLTAKDFSVAEDKQPQRILSFDTYDFDKLSIARGPNARALPPNLYENIPATPERGPLYVMLLDLVNTSTDHQMWSRQQVLKFVSSKPAGTRFAIFVTTDKLYLVQGFTDDKDALYAAVEGNHPKPHVPRVFLYGRNYGQGDPYTAEDMLTHIGQYLDGIPGRKNLIWLADAFPLALGATAGADPSAYWETDVKGMLNSLAQAEIAVFPVNAGGIDPVDVGVTSLAGYAGESEIAEKTGGHAFYVTNDLVGAFTQATEEGGNYYMLTYAPPGMMEDDKCHNLNVKVKNARYQLFYRRYYCRVPEVSSVAENEPDQSVESPGIADLISPVQAADVLQANMKPGAPMLHDLIFSVHVHTEGDPVLANPDQMAELQEQAAFFRTSRRNKPPKPLLPMKIQMLDIEYRVLDPQLKAQAARTGKQATLEVAVAAFDQDGRVQNGVVNDAQPDASTQSSANKAGLYLVRQSLVVPVSATSIRMGVRDRISDRMGTLEVKLPLAPEPVAKITPSMR